MSRITVVVYTVGGKSWNFQVAAESTIGAIKGLIEEASGIAAREQRLLAGLSEPSDEQPVATVLASADEFLTMVRRSFEALTGWWDADECELQGTLPEAVSRYYRGDASRQEVIDKYGEMKHWDVSQVTCMQGLFTNKGFCNELGDWEYEDHAAEFNEEIGNWNTANVTDMRMMFQGAKAFNQPLAFDTGNVTSMHGMFYEAAAFNQPLSFNTAKVTNMCGMFLGAVAFNQPLSFDTGNVTFMAVMFHGAVAFNQPLAFNTAKVADMFGMFQEAAAFNQPLLSFSAESLDDIRATEDMFTGATAFDQPETMRHLESRSPAVSWAPSSLVGHGRCCG